MSTETDSKAWTLSVKDGQALWDVIALVRDASARLANDAETEDIVDALAPLIEKLVREAQAAELRRLAPLLSDRGTSADMLVERADELAPATDTTEH